MRHINKIVRGIAFRLNRWLIWNELGAVDTAIFQYTDCLETVRTVNKFHKVENLCDIGAHKGRWSYVMHQLNPELKSVVMFEPQEKLIKELETCDLPGVDKKIYQVALGDVPGTLNLSGGTASASLLKVADNQNHFFPNSIHQENENVRVELLDDFYAKHDLVFPDLIKMDVQGYELYVLKGGVNLLANAKYLVIEISLRKFYEGQPELSELFKFLEDSGYLMVDRGYELRARADTNELLQFDAIFMNQRFNH